MSSSSSAAPNPHASAAEVEAAWKDPKLANILYHDWEATTYDEKWSISFDERCIDYARDRFSHVAGTDGWPYATSLELGCGTGFFTLNLKLAGVLSEGHVTDLSPGMVEVAQRNARSLGFEVGGRVADAERLPYDDDSFDLVIGHAVLHHIPDVELSLRECLRVLKPGGRFVFAGEPTRHGDYVARRLSRLTWWAATRATRLPALADWRRPQEELDGSSRAAALEAVVDIHTFPPAELEAMAVRAGATAVRVTTNELFAAWFGWPVRTFEYAVPKGKLGMRWATFAGKGWTRLSAVDRVLEHVVPVGLFYNAEITGLKPLSVPKSAPVTSFEWPVLSRRPELVLFDLDGTLSDSASGILASLRHAFDVCGLPRLDHATERALLGPPFYDSLPPLIGDAVLGDVIAAYREHYRRDGMYDTSAYAGIHDVLGALWSAGVPMAVATSKPEDYAAPIVDYLGLSDYFVTVGGDELDGSLPTKALVINKVLGRLGYPEADTVLMVGDRSHDVLGARAHGIETIAVEWGYAGDGELVAAAPALTVPTTEELARAFGWDGRDAARS